MKTPRLKRVFSGVSCVAAASVALGLSSDPAAAQFRGCAVDDSRCIEISQQCRGNDATIDSCLLSFVAELQSQQGISPTTAIGTTIGLTYFDLAQRADDGDDEALYLTRAREAFLDVIASDEAAADAYGMLSLIDSDSIATLDAYSEAIDTARAAYDRAERIEDKWQFAILILGVYESANAQVPGAFAPGLVDEFLLTVREDSNWELLTRALAAPARAPTAMGDALETACQLAAIYGEEFCMRGIEATVHAAIRYPDIPDAQVLADAAAIGIVAAPRITGVVELPGGVRVVGADIGTPRLTEWLDELVNSRLDSLVVLDAVASTVNDLNRRFEVRREIVSRNPNSGRARLDLAQQYFNRKEWELAHVQLELARELLPPDDEFRYLVREYLFKAEYEIRARN